jgi:carbohydrate diacid regulator
MDAAIANKIIEFIFTATGRDSIICDVDGAIVHAKVSSRIGDIHPGARKMLRENLPHAIISKEEEEACSGIMKTGCNLPIWHNGELIGSIGITGDPE